MIDCVALPAQRVDDCDQAPGKAAASADGADGFPRTVWVDPCRGSWRVRPRGAQAAPTLPLISASRAANAPRHATAPDRVTDCPALSVTDVGSVSVPSPVSST